MLAFLSRRLSNRFFSSPIAVFPKLCCLDRKITRTPYFPARNGCFSEAFLRFAPRNFAKNHCFALEIQDSQRFSWGHIWSHISGQKTAFHTENARAKLDVKNGKLYTEQYPKSKLNRTLLLWDWAVDHDWLTRNPFKKIPIGSFINRDNVIILGDCCILPNLVPIFVPDKSQQYRHPQIFCRTQISMPKRKKM